MSDAVQSPPHFPPPGYFRILRAEAMGAACVADRGDVPISREAATGGANCPWYAYNSTGEEQQLFSTKLTSQNQFNECRCPLLMMKSLKEKFLVLADIY